jgi:hypothetical protein
MDRGWKAYSLQVGNNYLPFEYWPPFLLLGAIGNFYDAQRYEHQNGLQAFGTTVLGIPGQILNRTVLMGLKNLVDMSELAETRPASAVDRIIGWAATQPTLNVPVVGSIFLKALNTAFDNRVLEKHGWAAVTRALPVPGAVFGVKPRVNVLGESIHATDPYWGRFWSGGEAHTPADHIFDFLNEHQIAIGNPTQAKIGGKAMTPDQLYDYTILRGQALQRMLYPRLDDLGQVKDDAVLRKEIKKIEAHAHHEAVSRMVQGEHGVAQ